MNDVLTPAATDKSNVSGETWDAISVKTPGRTCGFTARTTTSETRATSPLDASDRVKGLRRREGMTTWKVITTVDDEILEVRSISHWSPYDRDGVVNADP